MHIYVSTRAFATLLNLIIGNRIVSGKSVHSCACCGQFLLLMFCFFVRPRGSECSSFDPKLCFCTRNPVHSWILRYGDLQCASNMVQRLQEDRGRRPPSNRGRRLPSVSKELQEGAVLGVWGPPALWCIFWVSFGGLIRCCSKASFDKRVGITSDYPESS